jgi:hypothetical protein
LQEQENSLKKLQNYQKRNGNNTKSNIICIIAPCSPYFPFFRTGMINERLGYDNSVIIFDYYSTFNLAVLHFQK